MLATYAFGNFDQTELSVALADHFVKFAPLVALGLHSFVAYCFVHAVPEHRVGASSLTQLGSLCSMFRHFQINYKFKMQA